MGPRTSLLIDRLQKLDITPPHNLIESDQIQVKVMSDEIKRLQQIQMQVLPEYVCDAIISQLENTLKDKTNIKQTEGEDEIESGNGVLKKLQAKYHSLLKRKNELQTQIQALQADAKCKDEQVKALSSAIILQARVLGLDQPNNSSVQGPT